MTTSLAALSLSPSMALAILNQPCTSRFASAVYANLRPRRHSRQTIREFSFTASALQIDRKKAVEAASENIELSEVCLLSTLALLS